MTEHPYLHPDELLGHEIAPGSFSYSALDVSLYALGIGAARDGLDRKELQYVFENHKDGMKTLPTFGVMFPSHAMSRGRLPGVRYNPENGLHGEEILELFRPIPTFGKVSCRGRVKGVYDKGSGAVIHIEATTSDDQGELARHETLLFIRGLGGWGGDRGPSGKTNTPPARNPDVVHREAIPENQALIYRLSGDTNPLHIDPDVASAGAFQRPILHGLCTYGFASRAVILHYAGNDSDRFRRMGGRFANPVYPGETLVTEMWQEAENRIVFQCKVAERDVLVLSNAHMELR
jgi:acyl dehydratase